MAMLLENPIVVREVRSRMRGGRAVWLQVLYVVVLSIVTWVAYRSALRYDTGLIAAGKLGRTLFDSLSIAQGVLLALTAPAFAAGAFTLEREQQTLDTLLVSPLRTSRIVRGKLAAATLFLLLLLTISVPLLALSFLFGGVSPAEVFGTYLVQLLNGLFLASVGVLWSLVCSGTATAITATYLTVVAYLIASTAAFGSAESGFVLGALSPVTASHTTGQTMLVAGTPVPLWIPAAIVLALATAWCADLAACRAWRIRNHARSGRPRAWFFVLTLVGLAATAAQYLTNPASWGAEEFRQQSSALLLGVYFGGLFALLAFATDEVDTAEYTRGRWWQVHRSVADSGPLFVALLLPLVWAVLLPLWAAYGKRPDLLTLGVAAANTLALMLSLVCCGWVVRLFNELLGRRWPGIIVAGLALTALLGLFALGTTTTLGNPLDTVYALFASFSPWSCVIAIDPGEYAYYSSGWGYLPALSVGLTSLACTWALVRWRNRWMGGSWLTADSDEGAGTD